MKREIKFRGKFLDNGKYRIGLLIKICGEYHIIEQDDEHRAYQVKPDTIGQYTGLTANNGQEIYEDDIVSVLYAGITVALRVVFALGGWKLAGRTDQNLLDLDYYVEKKCVDSVIGNIYDNPELLKIG